MCNGPVKLKDISSSLLRSQNPALMWPFVFKSPYSVLYWLWAGYPMGKLSLIQKGSAYHTCGCSEVTVQALGCIFNYSMYCSIQYSIAVYTTLLFRLYV